jgi:hypothetical protein
VAFQAVHIFAPLSSENSVYLLWNSRIFTLRIRHAILQPVEVTQRPIRSGHVMAASVIMPGVTDLIPRKCEAPYRDAQEIILSFVI